MRDRRVLVGTAVAALTLAGSLFLASPATAGQATGGTCTDSFTLGSDKQVAKLTSSGSLAEVQAVDKNGNGFVCYKPAGSGNGSGVNVIDDKI